jgi:hypothetical protein
MRACALLGLSCWLSTSPVAADKTKDWYESEGDEDERDEDDERDEGESDEDTRDEDSERDEFDTRDDEDDDASDLDFNERGTYLTPGTVSLYVGGLVGFGGSYHVEAGSIDSETDLAPTWGLQLGLDYVIHKYFALGAEFRTLGVISDLGSDANLDRELYLDLVLKPRGRYVFESSGVEVYGTLPVGLTVPVIPDHYAADTSVGVTLGVGVGASYFFTSHFGVSSDLVWLWHRYSAERTDISSGTVEEVGIDTRQITLFANLIYAL